MISRRILARHVIQATGLAMLGAVAVLLLLQMLFGYLAELGNLSSDYTAVDALKYIFMDAPSKLLELLPIAALMGSVIGLGTLAGNSELVVMRSVGVSLWRIVAWVMRPALILIVLSFCLSEWVIPYTTEQAKSIKRGNQASLGEVRGYWTREGDRFIYIDYANSQGNLSGINLFDFDQNAHLMRQMVAKSGQFNQKESWDLKQVQQVSIQNNGDAQQINQPETSVNLALQPKYVHMVTVDPDDLAPTQLVSFMHYLKEYSQVPKKYELAFWKQVSAPFALLALVVMACSFIFGPLRQQSMGFRLVIALFVGLGFYYLQDFLGYASLIYNPSSAWFLFIPIIIIFTAGAWLLHRVR